MAEVPVVADLVLTNCYCVRKATTPRYLGVVAVLGQYVRVQN